MTTTPRYVECSFPGRGIVAVVELLADAAPTTCRMFWDRLPIEADSYHTKWNGNEIFLVLPPFEAHPPENLTDTVQPGDVVLVVHPPGDRAAPAGLTDAALHGYIELGCFYGASARLFGPSGPLEATRVGRIVEGLDQLAEAARAMRRSGFEPMRVRRREPESPAPASEKPDQQ